MTPPTGTGFQQLLAEDRATEARLFWKGIGIAGFVAVLVIAYFVAWKAEPSPSPVRRAMSAVQVNSMTSQLAIGRAVSAAL